MYTFGKKSQERLNTCHPDIQAICNEVIKYYDFSVIEGIRTLEKQQEYFNANPPKTTLDGITKKSKHQDDGSGYSRAIDVMPYKKGTNAFSGDKKDTARFYFLAGYMLCTSHRLYMEGKINHVLRWGGDWDSDHVYTDQNFDDLPHFELVEI